jgi:hypothetical protein
MSHIQFISLQQPSNYGPFRFTNPIENNVMNLPLNQ